MDKGEFPLASRPTGRFTVRFASLSANTCAAFGATAIGDKGSRATYKRSPGMCPAPWRVIFAIAARSHFGLMFNSLGNWGGAPARVSP